MYILPAPDQLREFFMRRRLSIEFDLNVDPSMLSQALTQVRWKALNWIVFSNNLIHDLLSYCASPPSPERLARVEGVAYRLPNEDQ
jgi:hypothetical protein